MQTLTRILGFVFKRWWIPVGALFLLGCCLVSLIFLSALSQQTTPTASIPSPSEMSQEERVAYLRDTIEAYQRHKDAGRALTEYFFLREQAQETLEILISDPQDLDQKALQDFQDLLAAYNKAEEELASRGTGSLVFLILVVVFLSFLAGVVVLVRRLIKPRTGLAKAVLMKNHPPQEPKTAQEQTQISDKAIEPIAMFESRFEVGDDFYKAEFPVVVDGKSLGRCGIDIAETMRKDSISRQPIAFEIWLLDTNDIAPKNLVIASPWAFRRAQKELALRGDVHESSGNKTIALESLSFRLEVRIVERVYGAGFQDPESFFEQVKFELRVFRK